MNGNPTDLGPRRKVSKRLPSKVANALRNDARLGIDDDERLYELFRLAQQTGEPAHHERFIREARARMASEARDANPFLQNLPDRQVMRRITRQGGAPLCYLSNGQALRLPLGKFGSSRNAIWCGPTGSGKSSALLMTHLSFSGRAHQWIFDKKGDMARLAKYEQPGDVIILNVGRAACLSLADGLANLSPDAHIAEIKRLLLANARGLSASGRFLTGVLNECYKAEGAAGLRLSRIISRIESLDSAATSRLGGYKTTCLNVLVDLQARSGGLFDAPPSNFIDRLLAPPPRTCIFDTGGLSADVATFYLSILYSYVYHRRRTRHESEPPVIISIDDAMNFLVGSSSSEREGRAHPIADFSLMGRSLGIGIFCGIQCISLVSPTLLNNTATVVSLGAYGGDAAAVTRLMDLTPEQSSYLPTLVPGEAIVVARTVWPFAVYGQIPEVK